MYSYGNDRYRKEYAVTGLTEGWDAMVCEVADPTEGNGCVAAGWAGLGMFFFIIIYTYIQ